MTSVPPEFPPPYVNKGAGNLQVCTGPFFNLLTRSVVTADIVNGVVLNTTDHPISCLSDLKASEVCMGTAVGQFVVDIDADQLSGMGGFETLTGWSQTGTNSLVASDPATTKTNGSWAAKLLTTSNPAINPGRLYKVFQVPAGMRFRLYAWMKRDSAAVGGFTVTVTDQDSGGSLDGSTGLWTSTGVALIAPNATGWSKQTTVEFTTHDNSDLRNKYVNLLVSVKCTSTTNAGYIDDLFLVPVVDFFSVHGHDIVYGSASQAFSNDGLGGGAAITLRGTGLAKHPSYYLLVDSNPPQRYWKFNAGTAGQINLPWIGELVMGQFTTLRSQPPHPGREAWKRGSVLPSVDNATELGEAVRVPLAAIAQRTRTIPMQDFSNDDQTADIVTLYYRTGYGQFPMILIPRDDEDEVLLCKIVSPSWEASSLGDAIEGWTGDLQVVDLPFPLFTT